MLTDACSKEDISATVKPETSRIGHYENDNSNNNINIFFLIYDQSSNKKKTLIFTKLVKNRYDPLKLKEKTKSS